MPKKTKTKLFLIFDDIWPQNAISFDLMQYDQGLCR